MVAIARSDVTIYIATADIVPSDLASSDAISGEITSWEITGGNQDVESRPAFGGFVDVEKAREQFECTMEIIPKLDANQNRWDEFKFGSTLKSSGEAPTQAIFIQGSSSDGVKSWGMNNCKAFTWEPSQSADDVAIGTMTFKFSPETSAGVANLQTSSVAASTLPDWS